MGGWYSKIEIIIPIRPKQQARLEDKTGLFFANITFDVICNESGVYQGFKSKGREIYPVDDHFYEASVTFHKNNI